jgi:hypothetical protein
MIYAADFFHGFSVFSSGIPGLKKKAPRKYPGALCFLGIRTV